MGKPARVRLTRHLSSTPGMNQFWRVKRSTDGWNPYLVLELRACGRFWSRLIDKTEIRLEADTDVLASLRAMADKVCAEYWERRGEWTAFDEVEKFEGDHNG